MPRQFRRITVLTASLMLLSTPMAEAATADLAINENFPDPDVLEANGTYYAYGTNAPGSNIRTATASSVDGSWQLLPDSLPNLPGWVGKDTNGSFNVWAPDVSKRGDGSYLMYYTAFHAGSGRQCIGAATSGSPTGPFTPTSPDPLICEKGKGDIIDPASFVDSDGSRYLLYKDSRGPTARSGPSTIRLRPVAADGLTPTGRDVPLLRNDREDEHGVVEAPTLVRRPGGYVLFYSGNTFDSGAYFTNFATAPGLNGPFNKAPGELLNKDALDGAVTDPGGQDVLPEDGRIAFHGDLGEPGGPRGVYTSSFNWDGLNPVLE